MASRHIRPSSLPDRTAELAFAVPQAMAQGLTQLALAGPFPSESERREFQGLAQDNVQALCRTWFEMGWAVTQASQQAYVAMLQGARGPLR